MADCGSLSGQERRQLGDGLAGRLVHQPMAGALDDDALDIVGDQPALVDQELARRPFRR